jgi:Lipocalin-like domain
MERPHMLVLSAMTWATLALSVNVGFAQSAEDLVGAWTLVSAKTDKDATKSDTFGPYAAGVLVFEKSGLYTLTIIGDLPRVASNNRENPTPEEAKGIVSGSIAHFGTYTVSDKVITLSIQRSTFSNWTATEAKRPLVLTGDQLVYTVEAASAGGTSTVTWERAK